MRLKLIYGKLLPSFAFKSNLRRYIMGVDGTTRSATVFNRADKRAANYGTLSGTGDAAVATANKKILTALNAGAATESVERCRLCLRNP
jgi:hypothetical protein